MPRKPNPPGPSFASALKDDPIRRIMVRLPDSVHHRVRVMAAEQRTTMAEIIREAVERAVMKGKGGA
jgi:hypothetical protein